MQDGSQQVVRTATDAPLHFAGLRLDLGACTLTRDCGEDIPLTRGELALLRAFVARPGRVLSRDALLDAVAGRRSEPFDRSIDVLVGRLRAKIEPDRKQPRLIVTVPGEGYRFDAKVTPAPEPRRCRRRPPLLLPRVVKWRPAVLVALLLLILAVVGLWRAWPGGTPPPSGPPRVAVLPFVNLSGDSSMEYLGRAVAFELSTMLGSFPGLRVLSTAAASAGPQGSTVQAARSAGADYVVQGGVHRLRNGLRVTAQLYDGASGTALWSERIDAAGTDPVAMQENIATRIYDSLAGLRGGMRQGEQRLAWSKDAPRLDEFDYYLRGLSLYLRFSVPDVLKARAIWQEGLERFPGSALLRIKLGFSHIWMVMNQASADPRDDIERAWRFAHDAAMANSLAPLTAWALHWQMALLYQWHDNDFARSVAEARAAVGLVPYDAMSRNDLSWILANAGLGEEAVAWARAGLEHDPNAPSWFHFNLAWALYVAGRDQEAVDAVRDYASDFAVPLAAIYVRLGRVEQARAVVAAYMKSGGKDTVALEALYPFVEPKRTEYLVALRTAGLPGR